MPLIFDVSTTNSPGFLAGSGRHSMPSNTLKMAVFAPMPRPSASTATSVNPGLFTSTWKAYRRSLRSVSNETTLLAGPRFGTLTVRQARTLDRPNLAAMDARGRLSCYTQAGISVTIRKVAIETVAFTRYACPHRSPFHAKSAGPHGHCKRDRLCPTTHQFGRYFGVDGQFCG